MMSLLLILMNFYCTWVLIQFLTPTKFPYFKFQYFRRSKCHQPSTIAFKTFSFPLDLCGDWDDKSRDKKSLAVSNYGKCLLECNHESQLRSVWGLFLTSRNSNRHVRPTLTSRCSCERASNVSTDRSSDLLILIESFKLEINFIRIQIHFDSEVYRRRFASINFIPRRSFLTWSLIRVTIWAANHVNSSCDMSSSNRSLIQVAIWAAKSLLSHKLDVYAHEVES